MKAKLFEKLDNKKVRCLACSHYCKIPERKTGICGIRKNKDGELYLLTYGKPTGLQIDPIEKKPLYHFLVYTVLSFIFPSLVISTATTLVESGEIPFLEFILILTLSASF